MAREHSIGFRAYGAAVIRKRLRKMLSYRDAVVESSDVEALHDMRVASRRLRAALRAFGPVFEDTAFPPFQEAVRQTTRVLGGARDLDVQLQKLAALRLALPPEQAGGLAAMEIRRRAKRERAQVDVREALGKLSELNLGTQWTRIAARCTERDATFGAPDDKGAFTYSGADPSGTVYDHARGIVHAHVGELHKWAEFLPDPANSRELHQMRIAAKRLRYTMELFGPFYPKEFTQAIDHVKALQEQLGEIHDADVLMPELARQLRRMASSRARSAIDLGRPEAINAAYGILASCKRVHDERVARHVRLLFAWSDLFERGFFERIECLLSK